MRVEAECANRKVVIIREDMKNTEVYFSSQSASFMENVASEEEIITTQATSSYNSQPIRSLPNILRSNNTRIYKSHKGFALDDIDTTFASGSEDANTSFESNAMSFNLVDVEMEVNYSKITSSKSHHQRKQVHNPLDVQYDTLDWNNNRDKNMSQSLVQLDTTNISPDHRGENAPTKKSSQCRGKVKRCCSSKKKSTKARKSDSGAKISCKKLIFDSELITVPYTINDDVIGQNSNNIWDDNMLIQSTYQSKTLNSIDDLNVVGGAKPIDTNSFHCNNEICNLGRKCSNSYNPVISASSTRFNATQRNTLQWGLMNCDLPITESDSREKSTDGNATSKFQSKLYTCTCANCTSYEKDIVFYEDAIPSPTSSSDLDTELLACDFYNDMYDFYMNNYCHIFDSDWLKEFDPKVKPCCEQLAETNVAKENTCTSSGDVTELIESVNAPSLEQSKSEYSPIPYIDRLQDICVESSNKSTEFSNLIENVDIFDELDYLNLDGVFTKEGKIISQDETYIQTAALPDAPVPSSKCQPEKDNKDLYVIQCGRCGKLFNKKHQFSKHFTRCDFADKEDFVCHICDKIYRHKSSLAQHLKNTHQVSHGSHEKFYICNKCSKSYIRLRAFQRHVLLHDDN